MASVLLHFFTANVLLLLWVLILKGMPQPRLLSRVALVSHCAVTLSTALSFIVYRMLVINDALNNSVRQSACFYVAVVAALVSGLSLFALFGYLYEVAKDEEYRSEASRWNL